MTQRYQDRFPVAPVAVVSAISGIARIPTIVDARALSASSLLLEIYVDEDFQLNQERLDALLDVLECPVDLLHIETSEKGTLLVTADRTGYDFQDLFVPKGEV